jgi:hypothetical protein
VRQSAEAFGMPWAAFAYDATNMPLTSWSEGRWGRQGPPLPFVSRALFDRPEALRPETAAIIGAMAEAPDPIRRLLIDRTVVSLIEAGLWERLGYLILVGHTLQASLVNWVAPSIKPTLTGTPEFRADHYVAKGAEAVLRTEYALGGRSDGDAMLALVRTDGPTTSGVAGATRAGQSPLLLGTDPAGRRVSLGTEPGFVGAVLRGQGLVEIYGRTGHIEAEEQIVPEEDAFDAGNTLEVFGGTIWPEVTGDRLSAVAAGRTCSREQVQRLRAILAAYLDAIS